MKARTGQGRQCGKAPKLQSPKRFKLFASQHRVNALAMGRSVTAAEIKRATAAHSHGGRFSSHEPCAQRSATTETRLGSTPPVIGPDSPTIRARPPTPRI